MKLKKITEYWSCPSHPIAKKAGDSIFLLGTLLSVSQVASGNNHVALGAIILTWLGKTVSNMFQDTTQNDKDAGQ